jgi:hypothetical protein
MTTEENAMKKLKIAKLVLNISVRAPRAGPAVARAPRQRLDPRAPPPARPRLGAPR